MGALLRPSEPPPVPLRAKSLGKLRHPLRIKAREYGAKSLYLAAKQVSDAELGEHVSGARDEGPSVRSGGLVLTAAEVGLLLPFEVATKHLVDVLKERLVRESANGGDSERLLRIRLALTHAEALLVTLT